MRIHFPLFPSLLLLSAKVKPCSLDAKIHLVFLLSQPWLLMFYTYTLVYLNSFVWR